MTKLIDVLGEARAPALRMQRVKRERIAEMPVERLAKRLGFLARDRECRARHQHHTVAQKAQVHRIGARPALVARIAPVGEHGERPGGERLLAELEGAEQPALGARGLGGRFAAAREQQLERGQARRCAFGEQTRNEQLAVHQAASSIVRAFPFARWRERIRYWS